MVIYIKRDRLPRGIDGRAVRAGTAVYIHFRPTNPNPNPNETRPQSAGVPDLCAELFD